jgi:hypothetical protein
VKLLDTSNTSRRYFDELPASPTASSNTAPPPVRPSRRPQRYRERHSLIIHLANIWLLSSPFLVSEVAPYSRVTLHRIGFSPLPERDTFPSPLIGW